MAPATDKPAPPVRVLHVLAGLGAGGVETWLMNLLRAMDRTRFQFDFLLNDGAARFYDGEAQRRGAVVHRGPAPQRPVAYARHLRSVLAGGGYSVVHSHLYTYSGLVLWVADRAGVPVRIAHSHTSLPRGGLLRRGYERAMRRLIRRHATHGFGVSARAAAALFGPGWGQDSRFGVMDLGFDFAPFGASRDRAAARAAFGIPPGRAVVAHVGSYTPDKNHPFVLDIAESLLGRGLDVHLLLLTSPSHRELAAEVGRRGLGDRAAVPPTGADVPELLAAADVFVLPSRREGLGIVALEAQAAGVPVVASDAVPPEASVVPGLVEHVPLTAGPDGWAAVVAARLAAPRPDRDAAHRAMLESRFAVTRAWERLTPVYRGA